MLVLDRRLGGSAWLAGGSDSIAEMATMPYGRGQSQHAVRQYSPVERWAQAMLQRPAVVEGLAVGVARADTIEGRLHGFTDDHHAIFGGITSSNHFRLPVTTLPISPAEPPPDWHRRTCSTIPRRSIFDGDLDIWQVRQDRAASSR